MTKDDIDKELVAYYMPIPMFVEISGEEVYLEPIGDFVYVRRVGHG